MSLWGDGQRDHGSISLNADIHGLVGVFSHDLSHLRPGMNGFALNANNPIAFLQASFHCRGVWEDGVHHRRCLLYPEEIDGIFTPRLLSHFWCDEKGFG